MFEKQAIVLITCWIMSINRYQTDLGSHYRISQAHMMSCSNTFTGVTDLFQNLHLMPLNPNPVLPFQPLMTLLLMSLAFLLLWSKIALHIIHCLLPRLDLTGSLNYTTSIISQIS